MATSTPDLFEQRRQSIRNDLNHALSPGAVGNAMERLVLLGMNPRKAASYTQMAVSLLELLLSENNQIHNHTPKGK